MDASLWNDVIPTCPPITGAWHRRCPWRHTTTRCAPTPTCRCPGSPSWSPSSSTASTCATSPSSATTPAARPTARLRRPGPARADRSRLLRRVRQLPARSHRHAGADRQAPARAVWPVHAPHALAAGATAADRVRVADQARRRRHPPMDPTGPPPARDPPRHRTSPARGCGRERHARGGREPRGLPPPRAGGRANEDGVMPPDHGRCLTELLLQGRLVEIPDTDTLIPWTSPDGSRGSCVTSHGHRPATGQHGSRHDERSRRSALPGGVPERTPAGTVRASPMCRWMASLASRCFARTITQREDVFDSGPSAMATTTPVLLTAHSRHSSRPPLCRGATTGVCAIRRATHSAKLGAFSMTWWGRAAS